MKEIVIATKNKHKIVEIKKVLEPLGYDVLTLFDFDEFPEIIEDRDTFQGNALKKAQELSDYLQKDVISDDSGLIVDALHGAPGVYSARYAGEDVTYEDNNRLLLQNMKNIHNRSARFVTTMCLYQREKQPLFFEGFLEGSIATDYKGNNGFGYDPIFVLQNSNQHLAELSLEEKNSISHRAQALNKLIEYLNKQQEVV